MFASYHHSASRLFLTNHTNPFKHTNMLLAHQHSTSRHVHTNHTTPSTHQPASIAPTFYMLGVPDIATGLGTVCRSVLQCVPSCCSVMLCVAVCCSRGITCNGLFENRRCSVLLCVALCCSVLQCVAVRASHTMVYSTTGGAVCRSVSECVALCCSVLLCVVVCCSRYFTCNGLFHNRKGPLGYIRWLHLPCPPLLHRITGVHERVYMCAQNGVCVKIWACACAWVYVWACALLLHRITWAFESVCTEWCVCKK